MTDTEDKYAVAKREKAERLANSAPFDVHRWSDYPEVKAATDSLYYEVKAELPKGVHDKVQKRNLRVILLDLYTK